MSAVKISLFNNIMEYVASKLTSEEKSELVSNPEVFLENWLKYDNIIHTNGVIDDENLYVEIDDKDIDTNRIKRILTNKETNKDTFFNGYNRNHILEVKSPISEYYNGWREAYNDENLLESIAYNKGNIDFVLELDEDLEIERLFFMLLEILNTVSRVKLIEYIGYKKKDGTFVWADYTEEDSIGKAINHFLNSQDIDF